MPRCTRPTSSTPSDGQHELGPYRGAAVDDDDREHNDAEQRAYEIFLWFLICLAAVGLGLGIAQVYDWLR